MSLMKCLSRGYFGFMHWIQLKSRLVKDNEGCQVALSKLPDTGRANIGGTLY